MTTFTGAWELSRAETLVVTRAARANSAGGMKSLASCSIVAGIASWRSLADRIDSCAAATRAVGSPTSVGDRREHRGDPVAVGAAFGLGADGQGNHREQRGVRQLV